MIIEHKPIEGVFLNNELFGCIMLNNCAWVDDQHEMIITVKGKRWFPLKYDDRLNPIFSTEQYNLFKYMDKEDLLELGNEHKNLVATIKYTPLSPEALNPYSFDTVEGINGSLFNRSLDNLHKILSNRVLAHKLLSPAYELHEFVLFGKYVLDELGQVWWPSIQNKSIPRDFNASVETKDDFYSHTNLSSDFTWAFGYPDDIIPQATDVCPCCGKHFDINDVIEFKCTKQGGKFYHTDCWNNYRKLKEIYDLTEGVIDFCIKPEDYFIELLPNGYSNQKSFANIPWLIAHTIWGDIIIGKRKRVISIEWQSNFKPFDFDKLFAEEDVTKWQYDDGTRGIHAWMQGHSHWNDMAINYLKRVIKEVAPNYKRYSWDN